MAKILKFIVAAAAIPTSLSATQAAAETSRFAAPDLAKAEAIIGAPSALAAILSQQQAPVRALSTASFGRRAYPGYSIQNAVIRTEQPASVEISPAVYSGKPDIFGTVALKVGRTPLDSRWQRVENARVGGRAASYAYALHNSEPNARIDAINRYVNHRLRFVSDEWHFGRADVWSTANATLASGEGDCEDYAIAKLQMLRTAGFADRDLYLVVLRDLVRRADHAVAVVRSGEHMYVLDDETDRLLDTEAVFDYRPILTFSADGTWTHGYRVSRPLTVASNDTNSLPQAIETTAGDQRSRSASLLAFNTGFSR